MNSMTEVVATSQNRVLLDMIAELTRNRKSVPASQGLYALRRRINNLSTNGRRLLKLTSEQVVWQDGCFSVSTEAKWDETRCGRDIVLSNNNTTVTRSNGNEWGGVLGAQLYTSGNHSFTFHINKCQTDYVYIGVAYDNVDLNDNYNARNIVLRAGDGSFRVFSASQGCYGGFRTGDNIRVEVDMNDKVVTFYKNDVRLCQATGITASLRPFVSIGARDVVITMKTQDPKLALEVSETQPRSPMIDIAASGLKEEALCSAADFLKSISTSDVEADQQERQIAAMVLLELAVARGLLSFTLSIMVHLMEHNVILDASVFPTLRRLGNIDSISDPKLRSLFSESLGSKQGANNASTMPRQNDSQNESSNDLTPSTQQGSENDRVVSPDDSNKDEGNVFHKSLKISGDAQDARLIAEAAEQEVGKDPTCGVLYSVIILAQLEHAAKRLKSSNAVLAPCSVDASPRTLRQLHSLISSHSSIIDHLKDAEDCNVWSCYVLLALVRLLALNLRQIQRHPNMSELEPDLLASLRALLLKLVAGSAKTSAEGQIAYTSIQEEAVAALRAGTPVLFSDPVELVGLLEIMLPKHCEEKASQTEEQFLVMLLSYIAKPPVIWRVLQLDNSIQTDADAGSKKEISVHDSACLRFFECLLNSTMHYLKTSLNSGRDPKDPPRTNEVIPTACGEVLQVAWRLQHVHWSNLLASEDSKALALCSQMAVSALQHVVHVIDLTKRFIEVERGDCNVAVMILEQSAVYKFLPEILAGISSMPPHEKILACLNSLLAGLDSLSPKLPGVVLNALDPVTPADLRRQHELAIQRLSTQQVIKQQIVNANLNSNEESRGENAADKVDREVVAIQGASYLLVELDISACKLGSSGQLTIEDGLGHVLAGRLMGSYEGSENSILPIIVPGETAVFNFSPRDFFKFSAESSESEQVAYKAIVTGYFAPSFSVECIEAHVVHPCNSNETSSPLALPDTTIVSQISFDPESCLKPSSCVALTLGGHLQVFTGENDSSSKQVNEAAEFLQSMDTSITSSEMFKDQLKSCPLLPFPSFPLLTVDPNIRFDHVDASSRSETVNDSLVAKGPVNSLANGKYGWKAFVCSVSVPRDADAHWMMEILRLTACVSAQLSGAMVSGLQGSEIETTCKKWITSDLLRGGRLEDLELENVTKDFVDKPLRLPGRPHPLRQSPILDKVESSAALAMLHHVGLLSLVKQNIDADGNVNMDEEEHVAVLRKIAMAAGNLRRSLMQQRDQQLADPERNVDSENKESPAAATNSVLNYDALCLPVMERAECLLRFVPALGKRQVGQACSESLAHAEEMNLNHDDQTDVSPTKKWQQAALRIIGSNGASSLANKDSEISNSHDAGTSIDVSAPSSSSEELTEDMSGGKAETEQQSGWSYVIPLIRVHRAYWRVKQRVKQREDNIIDLVSKFLLLYPDLWNQSLSDEMKGKIANEIENGLRFLAEMLEHLKVRVVRAEILQALFNSNWSVRHYLSDISAGSALKIGRVRALFNKVCRLLVDILKDPSSSCQLKGFAASSLVMLYEAPDLTYLNMIGLPNVLREFVDTNGERTAPLLLGLLTATTHWIKCRVGEMARSPITWTMENCFFNVARVLDLETNVVKAILWGVVLSFQRTESVLRVSTGHATIEDSLTFTTADNDKEIHGESIANRDMSEASNLPGEDEKTTYDSLGEGDFYSSLSSRSSPSDAEMKQLVARESVWRLLRILLLQISDNMTNLTNGQICEAQRSLWGTLLAAMQQLSARVELNSPAVLLDCGRAAVVGSRCVESVTASSSGDQVPNLLLPDMTSSWTSGTDGEHWVQIVARNEVCLSRMGVYIHPDDGAMMPREIRILAGENEGCLRAIQVVEVDPRELNQGPNEVVVLQGSDENLNVVRLCLTSNGPNVRLRGISVRGFMFGDPNVIGRGEMEEACIFKRVEVSTGKSAKKFLTDGRNDTFWQSDGRSGQHWIRLHVEPDAVITGLSIQVSASDGNYCPSLVDVFVGEVASNLKKIRTCNLTPTGNQRCVLLDKVNLMHRIVQVNIRENNGGCDCKVRGIFLTGHFAPTKRPGLDVGNTGQVLRDLLSTAYATSKARVVGINPVQSREWIRMLTKLMQLPVFGEATRIRATTLLHKLCVSWANMEGTLSLDEELQEDVIHAILDTLSHTSEICASMEPLSPTHLSPLPDLHSLLCKVAVDLIATPAWMPIMQPSIKESLTYLLDMYSPKQKDTFVKYDFMEVWWSSSNDYEATALQGHEFFRPTSGCKPRVVLFSASAPEPMRMLLNLSGLGNDTSQSSSFHIESFDVEVSGKENDSSKPTVSGVYVWLRPLSTPGRPQMGSSRYLMFDLIKKSRRGSIGRNGGNVGGVILAQSLEHLLQLMKGENISSSEADMGSGSTTIPTDIPWFVRLGKLTDKGPVLLSTNWTMLAGCKDAGNNQSSPPVNHILPSPVPTALPAVLLAEGIAQRSQLSDVACELFPSLLQVLTVISQPDPSEPARPHGLRVLHSRLVRAAYLFLQIPLCMEILLLEQGEPLRDILLLLASQDVNAPLVLALDDLLSKSSFLCQRLGPDAHLHTLSLPRSIVGSLSVPRLALSWGGKSAVESSIETIDTEPVEAKSQSQLLTWTSQSRVIQENEGDDEERRVEDMVACMFANAATEEHLLLPTSRREPDKSKPPSHTWSKKMSRYRTPRLLTEIATTEDAIAIYYARLALLTILHAAPTGSLPLTVENLATILRRLFRTVKPDLSSQSWRQSMRKVLDNALTASDEERPNVSKVLGLSKHCSWLLTSLSNKVNTEKDRATQLTPPPVTPTAAPSSSLKVMRISLESRHGYAPNTHLAIRLRAHGASALRVSLDPRCCSKRDRDKLTLYSDAQLKQQLACYHGPSGAGNWAPPPDIQGNSLVVIFESDGGHGEWGFRIYIQPLDAEMRAISVPSFLFESVPAYSQNLRGKHDVTLYADNPDMGDSSIKVMFDKEFCSAQPNSTDSGRLKIISSRGKHLFQSSSPWEAMDIPRASKFTIDVKGPATNRLVFRFFSSLQSGDSQEDGVETLSLTPEGLKTNGEDGISAGVADFDFICWLMNALSSPSSGLLWKCKLNSDDLQREIKNLIEAGLVAIEHVAGSSRPGLLRSIASAARGLRRDSQGLSESALSIVRVLREAAIHQHAVELPQVGSQRAQFSPGLQALVEVVAVLDQGTSIDLSSMSRKELIRAIEAVDGPPGTALCKAVLEGNEEQVRWCLCRGARADAPCTERLVSSFPVPHYAIHYAVYAGRDDLVKLLFSKHADLHSIDGSENQPLAWAASRGMKSTVEVLLQLGADCRHRNSAGKTALDLATQAQSSSASDDSQHTAFQKPDLKGVIQGWCSAWKLDMGCRVLMAPKFFEEFISIRSNEPLEQQSGDAMVALRRVREHVIALPDKVATLTSVKLVGMLPADFAGTMFEKRS
ncbi:hypothetical protein GUITHDRAFT_103005 [Guillardia theta CCMP2712]|uniref:B30.2/SPRY domain-containing protein n=1 Tax=Guillardia theta (strain CCMP2712) TaxID=905079 RepID=L1JRZ6_GUITC|nr:hypothetical protein GUITHDRAFT_103005 [Guillardia theta CCMP2712]EKX51084.1 hypothetical protein GUITHDRAFT_103005 [Guillardia theta CCMP2712]|eukprot:XP_005838064.1 hypothetical protein GUITHDRAFT_103005 [Guillardia theta CCMP2712]